MLPFNKNEIFMDTCSLPEARPHQELSDTKDGTTQHTDTFLEPDVDACEYYYYMDTGTPPETLLSPSSVPELCKEDTAPLPTKKNDNSMATGTPPETQPSPFYAPSLCKRTQR